MVNVLKVWYQCTEKMEFNVIKVWFIDYIMRKL